jgi:hypothetical protein
MEWHEGLFCRLMDNERLLIRFLYNESLVIVIPFYFQGICGKLIHSSK